MRNFRPSLLIVAGLVLGLLIGGTTVAIAATSGSTVKVCTTSKGVVRSASTSGACPKKTTKKTINVTGPAGAQGAVGPQGVAGAKGAQGVQGTPGAPGIQGIQGPPSTDINFTSYDTNGATILQLGDINLTAHCTGGQVNLYGYSASSAIRVSGTHANGTGAPVSDRFVSSGFTPAIQQADSAWVNWLITNQTTGESVTLQLLGYHEYGNYCRFTGQLTR